MPLRPLLLALALAVGLSSAADAQARAIKSSEIDAALSSLPADQLVQVREAEAALQEAEAAFAQEKIELDAVKVRFEAAKLRVTAVDTGAKAIRKDIESATLLGNQDAVRAGDADLGKAERETTWREALRDAVKLEVQVHTARVAHAKEVVSLREKEVETARLTAWKNNGGSADVDTALGTASTQVGRARKAVEREQQKLEKAEGKWNEAERAALRLAP